MEGVFQPTHILVLGGLFFLAIIVAIVFVMTSLAGGKRGSDRLSSLEAENERLREEINRLKGGQG